MIPLSIGKIRGLQQCATQRGGLAIFALDHRNNLRRALHPEAPATTTDAEMIAFKQQVVAATAPAASAVLLDPEVGGAQCIAAGVLPGKIGLVVALEATGYTGNLRARRSDILPGWSVMKAKRMGANAVKLLIYYHPDAPTAPDVEALVRYVATTCAEADLPFFLEPLSYALRPDEQKLSGTKRREVIIETARRLAVLGADVLKAEFPVDISAEADEQVWAEACAELSQVSPIPWVLLSAGVSYETYLRQATIACQNGASGVAVGRAVWQEAATLKGTDRETFLRRVARSRLQRLSDLVNALARPWTDYFAAPSVDAEWYRRYGEAK